MNQHSNVSRPINEMVDQQFQKQVSENRKKLAPIVDTVLLCGRTGLPLRGHRDDSKYHPPVGEYSQVGVGNFIELLNFAVCRGDKVLKDHLQTCAKNASFISKNSQSEILDCCGKAISNSILRDVKKANFFQ